MPATIVLLTLEVLAMIVATIAAAEADTAALEVAAAREAAPVMAAAEDAKSATRRAVQDHVHGKSILALNLAPENLPDPAGSARDLVHGKSLVPALIRSTLARNQSLALDLIHVRPPNPARRSRSARSLATRRRSARRSSLSLAASHAAALVPSHATRRESAATLAAVASDMSDHLLKFEQPFISAQKNKTRFSTHSS